LSWDKALRLALLRIRVKPRNKEGISPFEILFGRPYQLSYQGEDMVQMGEGYLHKYLIALGKQISNIQKLVLGTRGRGLDQPIHMIKPGDWVFVKTLSSDPLGEKWNGPYEGLLTTFTEIKIHEQPAWIHYSRVKKASAPWTVEHQSPLKIKITRRP